MVVSGVHPSVFYLKNAVEVNWVDLPNADSNDLGRCSLLLHLLLLLTVCVGGELNLGFNLDWM